MGTENLTVALIAPTTDNLLSVSQETVVGLFMENVYKLHGLHKNIVSERDKIDGQTERVNKCVEGYLRCMVFQRLKSWKGWLHLAEWWYNTNYHSGLQCTPFQALYCYAPPLMGYNLNTIQGGLPWLTKRNIVLATLRENLLQAQNRMKLQVTLAIRSNLKLSSKYYGPYQVIEKSGVTEERKKKKNLDLRIRS
ncbi:uncharacterized protein LOC116001081 [Ipomoea triloba]|uniref:uncharacterized protein LOC116001081 n=1 Tax=Ipomoea triloba TaxID=35885 RepID=UPI00125D6545|nr:uncharacterized protein LOC116001081 [Ipomoea triloba]